MGESKESHLALLAIVGIVAVVGLVGFLKTGSGSTVVVPYETGSNIGGQAASTGYVYSDTAYGECVDACWGVIMACAERCAQVASHEACLGHNGIHTGICWRDPEVKTCLNQCQGLLTDPPTA